MRAAAKVLVVTGIAVALLVAVLYVAVPPNTTPEQGSADPILFARRPVFKLLGAVGLIKFDERFPNPYLPAAMSTTTWEELVGSTNSSTHTVAEVEQLAEASRHVNPCSLNFSVREFSVTAWVCAALAPTSQ